MHQIVCRLGLCPRPTGGAYIAPQTPRWFRGGSLGEWEGGRGGEKEEGREGRGRDGKGGEGVPECPNPELASLLPSLSLTTEGSWVHLGGSVAKPLVSPLTSVPPQAGGRTPYLNSSLFTKYGRQKRSQRSLCLCLGAVFAD